MMGYIMPPAGGIMAFAANNHVTPLDLMFFYTPAKAFEMMDKYGEAGRAVYLKIELTADIIYPIIYTLFMVCSFPGCSSAALNPVAKYKNGMSCRLAHGSLTCWKMLTRIHACHVSIKTCIYSLAHHDFRFTQVGVLSHHGWTCTGGTCKSSDERIQKASVVTFPLESHP